MKPLAQRSVKYDTVENFCEENPEEIRNEPEVAE